MCHGPWGACGCVCGWGWPGGRLGAPSCGLQGVCGKRACRVTRDGANRTHGPHRRPATACRSVGQAARREGAGGHWWSSPSHPPQCTTSHPSPTRARTPTPTPSPCASRFPATHPPPPPAMPHAAPRCPCRAHAGPGGRRRGRRRRRVGARPAPGDAGHAPLRGAQLPPRGAQHAAGQPGRARAPCWRDGRGRRRPAAGGPGADVAAGPAGTPTHCAT